METIKDEKQSFYEVLQKYDFRQESCKRKALKINEDSRLFHLNKLNTPCYCLRNHYFAYSDAGSTAFSVSFK